MGVDSWELSMNKESVCDELLNINSISSDEKDEIKQIRQNLTVVGMTSETENQFMERMISKYGSQI
tara:strand:- start:150 stop:347 length:198 start_codon:yes stop_codon:yes gene_type:complete